MLRMLLSFCKVKLLKIFVQLINVWYWLADDSLAIVFTKLIRQILFLS